MNKAAELGTAPAAQDLRGVRSRQLQVPARHRYLPGIRYREPERPRGDRRNPSAPRSACEGIQGRCSAWRGITTGCSSGPSAARPAAEPERSALPATDDEVILGNRKQNTMHQIEIEQVSERCKSVLNLADAHQVDDQLYR